MHEHKDICDDLSAFLDGQLPPERDRQVRQAVQADAALQAELAQLQAVRGLLRQMPRAEVPEGFGDRVMARARYQGRRGRLGIVARAARFAVAASIFLALGVGILIGWRMHRPQIQAPGGGTASAPNLPIVVVEIPAGDLKAADSNLQAIFHGLKVAPADHRVNADQVDYVLSVPTDKAGAMNEKIVNAFPASSVKDGAVGSADRDLEAPDDGSEPAQPAAEGNPQAKAKVSLFVVRVRRAAEPAKAVPDAMDIEDEKAPDGDR